MSLSLRVTRRTWTYEVPRLFESLRFATFVKETYVSSCFR